jgi:SAM-dependent methyltransferase
LGEHGRFDVVICEQVLEHVPDPQAAMTNLRELCAPGGHVIVSTPFLIRVHELWGMHDYWRFTPRGLRTLMERAGLAVDTVGSWGNRRCVAGNLDHWPAYRRWHSLRDEPDLPVQVWAFARRPEELR